MHSISYKRVTNAVLRSSGLYPPSQFCTLLDSRLRSGAATTLPYIYYINVVDTSAIDLNADRGYAAKCFTDVHLPTEPTKYVDAGRDDRSIAIGLTLWRHRILTINSDHAEKLFSITNSIVASRLAIPRRT